MYMSPPPVLIGLAVVNPYVSSVEILQRLVAGVIPGTGAVLVSCVGSFSWAVRPAGQQQTATAIVIASERVVIGAAPARSMPRPTGPVITEKRSSSACRRKRCLGGRSRSYVEVEV